MRKVFYVVLIISLVAIVFIAGYSIAQAQELSGPFYLPKPIREVRCPGFEGNKCVVYDLPAYRQIRLIDAELSKYKQINFEIDFQKKLLQEKVKLTNFMK